MTRKEKKLIHFIIQFQKTYPDIYSERFPPHDSKSTEQLDQKSSSKSLRNQKNSQSKVMTSQDPKAALPPKPKLKQPLLVKPLLKLRGLRIWLVEIPIILRESTFWLMNIPWEQRVTFWLVQSPSRGPKMAEPFMKSKSVPAQVHQTNAESKWTLILNKEKYTKNKFGVDWCKPFKHHSDLKVYKSIIFYRLPKQ